VIIVVGKKIFLIILILIFLFSFVFAATFTATVSDGEEAYVAPVKAEDNRESVTLTLSANASILEIIKVFNAKMVLEFSGKKVVVVMKEAPKDKPIAETQEPVSASTPPASAGPTSTGDIESFTFDPSEGSDVMYDVSDGDGTIAGMVFFVIPDENKDKYKIIKNGGDQDFNIVKVGTNLYRMNIVSDGLKYAPGQSLPGYAAVGRVASDNLPNIRSLVQVNSFSKDNEWNDNDYVVFRIFGNPSDKSGFTENIMLIKDGNVSNVDNSNNVLSSFSFSNGRFKSTHDIGSNELLINFTLDKVNTHQFAIANLKLTKGGVN
jgi:hypothetical protein